MPSMTEALRSALTGLTKRQPPTFRPRISIKQMRAQQVLNALPKPAGWFLEYCSFPSTRPEVEKWISEAVEKEFELEKSDPAESRLWAQVANEMTAVCMVTNRVLWARQREEDGLSPESDCESALQRMARASAGHCK